MKSEKYNQLIEVAKVEGYEYRLSNDVLYLFKGTTYLEIDIEKGTMSSTLDHPKKGFTILHRNRLTPDVICRLIVNPREHTPTKIKTRYL